MVAAAILKNPNRDILAAVWSIATKFGMVTQFDTYGASHKFVILKIQDGGRKFEKCSINGHY